VDDVARRVWEAYAGYMALGHRVEAGPHGRAVRHDPCPRIHDANLLVGPTAADDAAIDALLAFGERALAGLAHRHVLVGPEAPPRLLARLALLDYRPRPTLQLVLDGPLGGPVPILYEIRMVSDEADWISLRALMRRDHQEGGRSAVLPAEVTDEMVAVKRAKTPALRFWIARDGADDVGYFSSWPGEGGVGLVEDLFTLPERRGRGVARALMHRAVNDARRRGAGPVVIGADPADTVKTAYARMRFRPVCLTWSWLRTSATNARGGAASG
jgi:GNAT superfamily N-acetyltransferase